MATNSRNNRLNTVPLLILIDDKNYCVNEDYLKKNVLQFLYLRLEISAFHHRLNRQITKFSWRFILVTSFLEFVSNHG